MSCGVIPKKYIYIITINFIFRFFLRFKLKCTIGNHIADVAVT